jgi:hypothetical protein
MENLEVRRDSTREKLTREISGWIGDQGVNYMMEARDRNGAQQYLFRVEEGWIYSLYGNDEGKEARAERKTEFERQKERREAAAKRLREEDP